MEQTVPPHYCDKKGRPEIGRPFAYYLWTLLHSSFLSEYFFFHVSNSFRPSSLAYNFWISGVRNRAKESMMDCGSSISYGFWWFSWPTMGELPQQQNLTGLTQSISHSFPAIHSCQRFFPYTEERQIISKPEKILIELLSHPFPSGVFTRKSRTNSSDRKGMNRIKLSIFIFFFLSTVCFSYFKKADYRTY